MADMRQVRHRWCLKHDDVAIGVHGGCNFGFVNMDQRKCELVPLFVVATEAVKSPVAGQSAEAETPVTINAHSDSAPTCCTGFCSWRRLWPEGAR